MAHEIEAKIRVGDGDALDALRQRLLALGAVDNGVAFERNWVFDDADGSLERRGALLRLRCLDGAADGVLTVKRRIDGGEFKTREEVESSVGSVENVRRQCVLLGYGVVWIYEKRRRTLLLPECVVALDECPEIGCFIEIEGGADRIREICAALGIDPARHIDNNYLGLWREHLDASGEAPRHMTFTREDAKGQTL